MTMKSGRGYVTAGAFLLLLPVTAVAAADAVQGISLSQQSADQWRGAKLVGIPIYGPDDKTVGKVTDVLLSHSGTVQDIIVGVGGFLGIGEKDVAIPYSAVSFSDTPIPVATAAPTNNMATPPATTAPGTMAPSGTAAQTAGMAPATPGLGIPAETLGNASTPPMGGIPAGGAAAAPSTAFPDHGTIAFTADQLKSAPAFKFAR